MTGSRHPWAWNFVANISAAIIIVWLEKDNHSIPFGLDWLFWHGCNLVAFFVDREEAMEGPFLHWPLRTSLSRTSVQSWISEVWGWGWKVTRSGTHGGRTKHRLEPWSAPSLNHCLDLHLSAPLHLIYPGNWKVSGVSHPLHLILLSLNFWGLEDPIKKVFFRQVPSHCRKFKTFRKETGANVHFEGAGQQLQAWLLFFWTKWGKKKGISWQPHKLWICSWGSTVFAQTTFWCSHLTSRVSALGDPAIRAPQMLYCLIKAKVLPAADAGGCWRLWLQESIITSLSPCTDFLWLLEVFLGVQEGVFTL